MQQEQIQSPLTKDDLFSKKTFAPGALLEYFGTVNYATNERVLRSIKEHLLRSPGEELCLVVTSAGGPTGTAMSFFDTVRSVLRAPLTTVGSGDVDSSGLIIFLSGERRLVTQHTTALLHRAGRVFEPGKRFTAAEMEAMVREDTIKDEQYASVLAERSRGALDRAQALALMEQNAVLQPQDLMKYGLADAVLRS